jgi:hypothetical protein
MQTYQHKNSNIWLLAKIPNVLDKKMMLFSDSAYYDYYKICIILQTVNPSQTSVMFPHMFTQEAQTICWQCKKKKPYAYLINLSKCTIS